MNLTKLFETQAALDNRIILEHPELKGQDNLDWKILALQVELAECANEWRGFKKWSNDQEPRNSVEHKCRYCKGAGTSGPYHNSLTGDCSKCAGEGEFYTNPLLEEYVDCLHFILSIGLELDVKPSLDWDDIKNDDLDITHLFLEITVRILDLNHWENTESWEELFEEFYLLGKMLGFTWDQIENAYFEKNKVNHARQESGY